MDLVTLDEIKQASRTLEGVALRTPLEHSRAISDRIGGEVYLKCENLQRTGSFKIRGAYNRIARLTDEERARGVVAASAGNHAQGVALSATLLNVSSTVFMPEGAALPKVAATEKYGAKVVLGGSVYDDAFAAAQAFADKTGAVMVHPFEHKDVIAGQGTIALEILDQLPDVGTIVAPIGGGGSISGIAAGAKALKPGIRIVGVEPAGAPNMSRALEAGRPVELDSISTITDGLALRQTGEMCLAHVAKFVDEVVTVTDEQIAEALVFVLERAKLVVEPAGAAGVAAVLRGAGEVAAANRYDLGAPPEAANPPNQKGEAKLVFPVVVHLSGGNVDPLLLLRMIRFGMGSAGRYFLFRTKVPDRPGELHKLLGVIADAGANVAGVEHHREGAALEHLGEVEVGLQVETRGPDHVEALMKSLEEAGYSVESR